MTPEEIEAARETKHVVVVRQEQYGGGPVDFGATWTEGSFQKVLDSLLDVQDSIPEEFRDAAYCQIDSGTQWDQCYAEIEIGYSRPETDAEVEARVSERKRDDADEIAVAWQRYQELKAKFEPKEPI